MHINIINYAIYKNKQNKNKQRKNKNKIFIIFVTILKIVIYVDK